MKNKQRIIILMICIVLACLVLVIGVVRMPARTKTLENLFGVEDTYTARFSYHGEWYDFTDSQYQTFETLRGEELKRGFTGNIGHSTTGDDITIEITGESEKTQAYTLIGDEIRYNDYYVYTPTDEVLKFIKDLAASIYG